MQKLNYFYDIIQKKEYYDGYWYKKYFDYEYFKNTEKEYMDLAYKII